MLCNNSGTLRNGCPGTRQLSRDSVWPGLLYLDAGLLRRLFTSGALDGLLVDTRSFEDTHTYIVRTIMDCTAYILRTAYA